MGEQVGAWVSENEYMRDIELLEMMSSEIPVLMNTWITKFRHDIFLSVPSNWVYIFP